MTYLKKAAIMALIVIVVIGGYAIYNWVRQSSFSGLVGSVSFPTLKTEKYTIDTPGINPRVYEFDTKSGYHCISLFRDNTDTAPAMQCFKTNQTQGGK